MKKINLCILSGKVINEIDLKFIYNSQKKNLGKKYISIAIIMLEIEKKQIVELHGYNEMADYIYRSILKEDKIILEGKLRNKYVEIEFINKI